LGNRGPRKNFGHVSVDNEYCHGKKKKMSWAYNWVEGTRLFVCLAAHSQPHLLTLNDTEMG